MWVLAVAVIGGAMLIIGSLGTWTTVSTLDRDVAIKGTTSQPPPFSHEVDDLVGAAEEEPTGGVFDAQSSTQEREARPFPKGVPDGVWTLIAGIVGLLAVGLIAWRRNWATIGLLFIVGLGAMTAAGIGIHDVKNEAGATEEELLPLGWGLVVASLGAIAVTASSLLLAFRSLRSR
jgi:hypothetical protein